MLFWTLLFSLNGMSCKSLQISLFIWRAVLLIFFILFLTAVHYSTVWMYPSLFNRSSMNEHLGCFLCFIIIKIDSINDLCICVFVLYLHVQVFLQVGLLSQKLSSYVVLSGINKLFYRSGILICIPTSNVWEHQFSPQPHQQNVLLFFLFLLYFILFCLRGMILKNTL